MATTARNGKIPSASRGRILSAGKCQLVHGYSFPVFDGKKTADIVGLLPFKGSEVQGSRDQGATLPLAGAAARLIEKGTSALQSLIRV